MNETICETVCVSAMAVADGYSAHMPIEEIQSHIADCTECRIEIEQMKNLMGLLDLQKRRELHADIWGSVARRLEVAPGQRKEHGWQVLLIAPLLLLGYKVAELTMEREPGIVFKLIPLLIAVAVFAFLKENPFKINMELKPEGE